MSNRLIAFAATVLALQGCATPPPPPQPTVNYNIGIAKTCSFTPADLSAATAGSGTIAMTNDGWCALRLNDKDGKPFQLGLLRQRPEHGHVFIQNLGGPTRLEYTADQRYAGDDKFSVALRSATANVPDTVVSVTVAVTMGEGMAPVAPPPAPTPSPTRARPRPATRSRAPNPIRPTAR